MAKTTTKKTEAPTADAQVTIEQGVEKIAQGIEGAAAFGQENVEAVVTSSKIAAKAAETMGAEIAAYSKKAYEDSMAVARELTTCTSMNEIIEKQTAFARVSMEDFVAEATKLSEMYAAAAKDAFEPLNARVTVATDSFTNARV